MRLPGLDREAGGWKLERRPASESRAWHRLVAILLGLAASLAFGVIVSGSSLVVFEDLWLFSFGSPTGIEDVATLSTPLILTGLAAAIPLRLGLWNIGAEGQLFIGAWAAAGTAFLLPDLGWALLVPLMFVAALIGGAAWALLPAIARVRFNVNEIITTLLLNFVAVYWVIYWAGEPWRDPTSVGGVKSKLIPSQAELPELAFGSAEIPLGFFLATAVALMAWFVLRHTRVGYEMTMLGASPDSARFAGIPTRRLLIWSLLVGGAMAGLAGTIEMMGNQFRYGSALSNNTGYTGIVVAVLAGGSAIGVVAIAIVFALIAIVGGIMRAEGTSSDIIFAMYGITLIVASIAQALASFRAVRRLPPSLGDDSPEPPDSRPVLERSSVD